MINLNCARIFLLSLMGPDEWDGWRLRFRKLQVKLIKS